MWRVAENNFLLNYINVLLSIKRFDRAVFRQTLRRPFQRANEIAYRNEEL